MPLPSTRAYRTMLARQRVGRKRQLSKTAHLRGPIPVDAWHMAADPCAYCGGVANHWEHVESLYRGGTNDADNLARACQPCNFAKNSQPLLTFLARRSSRRTR